QTMPQRSVVNQLQQSLSYTNASLTDAHAEQLVQILVQTSSKNAQGGNRGDPLVEMGVGVMGGPPVSVAFTTAETAGQGGRGGGGAGGDRFAALVGGVGFGGGNNATITNELIIQAQSVVSVPK